MPAQPSQNCTTAIRGLAFTANHSRPSPVSILVARAGQFVPGSARRCGDREQMREAYVHNMRGISVAQLGAP